MDAAHLALIGAAAVAGGIVNAIAGGGSLLTFPALVAGGLSAVSASVTNTVAMCPGYLGGTLAQRRDLVGQGPRAVWVVPAGALGGVAGALLLLRTGEATFRVVVPFLLVFAAGLLASQGRLRAYLGRRTSAARGAALAGIPIALAAVYGGYFGAGMSVIVLAALAIAIDDSLARINALKQAVALAVNLAAAIVFVIAGDIDVTAALVMAAASLVGGMVGGALAMRVPAAVLRWVVVGVALVVAGFYFAEL